MEKQLKTKQQEIDQLKRFLNRLEKNGYLETIFKGVLEHVEQDIRNDMAFGLVDTIKKLDSYWSECKMELARVNNDRTAKIEENVRLKTEIVSLKDKIESIQRDKNDAVEDIQNAKQLIKALEDQLKTKEKEKEKALASKDQDIIVLKADLYDTTEKIKNKDKMIHDLTDRIIRMNEEED